MPGPARHSAANHSDQFDFVESELCNWGELTSDSIAESSGSVQGEHASDPSGDGLGPEERVGLANVIEQGDLFATCEFIDGLLFA